MMMIDLALVIGAAAAAAASAAAGSAVAIVKLEILEIHVGRYG